MFIRSLSLIFALSAMSIACLANPAYAASQLDWRLYTHGQTYEKVWTSLPKEVHEYARNIAGGKGHVRLPVGMAAEDLNGDGRPELIAYVPRDYNLYTDDYPGDIHVVFSVQEDGSLKPVSTFRAFGILIAGSLTNGVRDLMALTDDNSGEYTLLAWSLKERAFVGKTSGVVTPEEVLKR